MYKASPTDEQIDTMRDCLAPKQTTSRTELTEEGNVHITEVPIPLTRWRSCDVYSLASLFICVHPPLHARARTICHSLHDCCLPALQVLSPRVTVDRLLACDLVKDGLSKNARFAKTYETSVLFCGSSLARLFLLPGGYPGMT